MPVRRFQRLHGRISVHRAAATLDMLEALAISNLSGSARTEAITDLQRRVTGKEEEIVTIHTAEDFKRLVANARAAALRKP